MLRTGWSASRSKTRGRACPRAARAPFTPSSAARPATGSGWDWRWCGASPRRTGEPRSRRTEPREEPGWASRCAPPPRCPGSGLLEHRAHDPPHHPQLVSRALAEVVAELGDLVALVAVEVVEQRPQRHLQPGGELVDRLQGGRERPALDPANRIDRERAPLRKLLLGQLAGMPERPEVRAEPPPDVHPHRAPPGRGLD